MASQSWTNEIHSFYGATPHDYDVKNYIIIYASHGGLPISILLLRKVF